jgi:hypothetical protein
MFLGQIVSTDAQVIKIEKKVVLFLNLKTKVLVLYQMKNDSHVKIYDQSINDFRS